MRAKYIIGGIIIVAFLAWGTTAFFQTTIQYVSLEEAASSDQTVQVMGKIDFDVVNYDAEDSRLEFVIYDSEAEDAASAQRLDVVYYGVVPGNFDQATSVVVKGKNDGQGSFVADQMLVKCPSKYQGEGGDYQDGTLHDEAVEASAEA
ncbi:MAG: cytochrome c maturation protein CcmE [bacterium]|nr:cytochrome c maturation protein CcmE [bacterium]